MGTEYAITETLDVKGESCPMPVVKAKNAFDGLEEGDVLEVLATDPGAFPDFEAWANRISAVEILEQIERENGETVYVNVVRKGADE